MHVVAAGDELVRHLAATEADPLAEDGPLMVLARAGALAPASRVEVAGNLVHREGGNLVSHTSYSSVSVGRACIAP